MMMDGRWMDWKIKMGWEINGVEICRKIKVEKEKEMDREM